MKRALTLSLLLATLAAAQAQTVWRCGPDGRSYSSTPCADGHALAIADARSDTERAAARDVVQRERQALARLSSERRERERDAVRRGLGPASVEAAAKPDTSITSSDRSTGRRPSKKRLRQRPVAGQG